MRYTIRRIGLTSVARLGCLLSGLAVLPPALCLAGITVAALERIQEALQQIEPLTLTLLGQELVRIDLLDALRLQPVANQLAELAQDPFMTFRSLTLILVLTGAVLATLSAVLIAVAYNLFARTGWGLAVELRDAQRPGGRG
ncbi:MAG: hypothetical protein ACRDHG_14100 [Anaerolineales bacterium]